MSQEGLFIITRPEDLEKACEGWQRGLVQPRVETVVDPFSSTGETSVRKFYNPKGLQLSNQKRSVDEVEDALQRLQPLVEEMTVVRGRRYLYNDAPVLFYVFDDDDDDETEAPCFFVFAVSDDDADAFMDGVPEWNSYANRETRHAAGLKVYFYLFSY
ncbi:MAG: hypothetical protein AB8H86_05710 [Polyangiales bacterium]